MIRIHVCVCTLLLAAPQARAQRSDPAEYTLRIGAMTTALLQSTKDFHTMGKALIDTPDWQVATNLQTTAERAINYCSAIGDLFLVEGMVSNRAERERINDFIRDKIQKFYAPLLEIEASDIVGEKARARSTGLAAAAESLRVQLRATKDSLLTIVAP